MAREGENLWTITTGDHQRQLGLEIPDGLTTAAGESKRRSLFDTELAKMEQPIDVTPKPSDWNGLERINLLAAHPCCFTNRAYIITHEEHIRPFLINNQGVQTNLWLLQLNEDSGRYLAVLPCTVGGRYIQ
jgi:hypothetical protein